MRLWNKEQKTEQTPFEDMIMVLMFDCAGLVLYRDQAALT